LWGRRAGIVAGLLFATLALAYLYGRAVVSDMTLTAFVVASIYLAATRRGLRAGRALRAGLARQRGGGVPPLAGHERRRGGGGGGGGPGRRGGADRGAVARGDDGARRARVLGRLPRDERPPARRREPDRADRPRLLPRDPVAPRGAARAPRGGRPRVRGRE